MKRDGIAPGTVPDGTGPEPVPGLRTRTRIRTRVEGTVQGVGFRPFVHRLAAELGLAGWVRNDALGVVAEVEGDPGAIDAFLVRVSADAPPLARVERLDSQVVPARDERAFAITTSVHGGTPAARVTPDAATCSACLGELWDPRDRRHRYPFVNCTDCGPRFTIVRDIPYDRDRTTMAGFAMCADCRAEYEDPTDRRFHAEPNACPVCGPRVRLLVDGVEDDGDDPVAVAAGLLRDGAILAVKGLGGYHLACRADDERAVATLRDRKRRDDKPFALMVTDVRAARELVSLSAEERVLLTGAARPIVLARRRATAAVSPAVAPGTGELGVMLAYTPLHHLLLADAGGPLVMTSGNRSDEPIAYRDDDARERLSGIADAILLHDRPVHTRTDDSVVRVVAGRRTVLRRARGLVPGTLSLPLPAAEPLLACGAQLKSTFCLARGDRAWVSHHVGDLDDAATRRSFAEGVAHFQSLFAVTPQVVVHDAHPDYASTAYALDRDATRHIAVQHHHAHLAAVLAEHGCAPDRPAIGAIYDGAGLGTDGTVWGGELLLGDLRSATRVGHLHPVALPGGDRAARQPWRMAAAWLVAAEDGDDERVPLPRALRGRVRGEDWRTICAMAHRGFASPTTTSMGRLFDAVAALCGVRAVCTYEGQAAIELEALAAPGRDGGHPVSGAGYPLPLTPDGVLDARPLIRAVVHDVRAGVAAATIAGRFHEAVARATARACVRGAADHAAETVVLAGGVFQNRRLVERTAALLTAAGLRVLLPERLPAGDGGISFGQAAVAAALSHEPHGEAP